jgi:NAD(P)-dependent dehydrogenase (short-subunit alcohol dehydrogenase family)
MKELKGRVAVVTGAASGIGRALARRFADEGMRIVLADVEKEALDTVRDELLQAGHEVLAVQTDVSDAQSVEELARRTLDTFGEVHVLCNNAGVFAGGRTWESPLSDYGWVLGVNLWGVIHGIRTFVPILLEQGVPAHIVNTASMAGVTSSPYTAAYNISKHGVVALSESLYHELTMENAPIGVSILCPVVINTGISQSQRNRPSELDRGDVADDPGRELVEAAIRDAMPRGLDPSEMADRVLRAIVDNRLYILSAAGGSWRTACEKRHEDIRLERNPVLDISGEN